MGRPIHADGRQTRQAILDAALDLFAEKGYFGTTLRDIATVVGVRESALYNYFQSKEALFDALITTAREHKAEQLAGLLAEPITDLRSVLEQLTTLLLAGFSTKRQQQLFRVLMTDGMRLAKEGRINLIERMTSGAASLQDLMQKLAADRGVQPRHPELLMIEFMGPLLLWRHWHAMVPHAPLVANREAFVRDHVDHFLNGTTARTGRQPAGAARRAVPRRPSRIRVAP